jgi:hypothetical protein
MNNVTFVNLIDIIPPRKWNRLAANAGFVNLLQIISLATRGEK